MFSRDSKKSSVSKKVYTTSYNTNNLSADEMPSSPMLIMISSSPNAEEEYETENIILDFHDSEDDMKDNVNMKQECESEPNSEYILGLSPTFDTYRSTAMDRSMKGKKSIMWNYFTPLSKSKATCNVCKANLSYHSSITNLKKHFERKHASIKITSETISNREDPDNRNFDPQASPPHIQSLSLLPSTSTSSISPESEVTQGNTPKRQKMQTTLATSNKKTGFLYKKALDDKLLEFITKDFQPLSIVEMVGFQEFTRALNPSYTLPSRKTLSTLLAKKYEEVKVNTIELIKSARSVTITTDCWTSCSNDSFLATTAHFINDEFQIKSLILDVNLCNSANLSTDLSRIIMDWDLENRILLFITDNTQNIKEAVSEELECDHLGCLAHTINLIVQDALELVQPLLTKISGIVSRFKQSALAKNKLDFYQKQNGKEPKKLIQSVCTRWNSVYYMLQRIVELKEEVRATLAALGKQNWPTLSNEEYKIIDELIKILDPIESTTKIMNNDKQVILSLVIIITNGLQDLYKQFVENNSFSAQSRPVLEKIASGISTRLRNMETSTTLLITTFLDPRFKHIGFSTDASAEKAKSLVTNALTELIEEKCEEKTTPGSGQSASDNQTPVSSIWFSFDKKMSSFSPSGGNKRSKAIVEIQRYVDQPLLDRSENPINWWRDNDLIFPHLRELVRLKFGTVATSIPCERIFSKTGQLLTERRNSLPENEVKQIMFIHQNSK